MSGTSGMLAALANFNAKNTTGFYPELYKIKMLILNNNKRGNTVTSYSYNINTIDYTVNILSELQLLFPNFFIYFKQSGTIVRYTTSGDYTATSGSGTNTFYISQTNLCITGTGSIVFTYTAVNTTPLTTSNAPFITISGAATFSSVNTYPTTGFTSIATPGTAASTISSGLAYTVVIAISYTFSSVPQDNFGLSFTSQFKTWLSTVSTLTITQLVNVPLSTAGSQFSNLLTSSFSISATNAVPIIRTGTSLVSCFEGCTTFNSNISGWDTSNVTNMSKCFKGCGAFNNGGNSGTSAIPLTWNTSRVTDMSGMFQGNTIFNQAISYNAGSGYWNTSNVTTIANIFNGASAFANASTPMLWILTGLNGYSAVLTSGNVSSGSTSISLWRNSASITAANAPAALTVNGLGSTLL